MKWRSGLLHLLPIAPVIYLLLTFCSTGWSADFEQPVDTISDECYWFNLGGGFGSLPQNLGEDNGGFSGGFSFSYMSRDNLFTVRWVATEEFELDLFGTSGEPAGVWDVGLLYGRLAKGKIGMASLSAGLGLVGASTGYYDAPSRIGIPIDGQLFWTPSDIVGLGLTGYADINSRYSFWGILFSIQLGKLR